MEVLLTPLVALLELWVHLLLAMLQMVSIAAQIACDVFTAVLALIFRWRMGGNPSAPEAIQQLTDHDVVTEDRRLSAPPEREFARSLTGTVILSVTAMVIGLCVFGTVRAAITCGGVFAFLGVIAAFRATFDPVLDEVFATTNSERRRQPTGNSVFVSAILLVTMIFAALGGWVYESWKQRRLEQQKRDARELVDGTLAELASQRDESGRLLRPPSPTLDAVDPWSEHLRVAYADSLTGERVTVRSLGPDRKHETLDDITASQSVVLPKEVGKRLMRQAGQLLREKLNTGEDDEAAVAEVAPVPLPE
ncbi:MAG TPA: hypothetical protein VMM76_02920 [Pirellulaceae bacterium]|nr:hypothetical protein [Pirellulaceae bacterium]